MAWNNIHFLSHVSTGQKSRWPWWASHAKIKIVTKLCSFLQTAGKTLPPRPSRLSAALSSFCLQRWEPCFLLLIGRNHSQISEATLKPWFPGLLHLHREWPCWILSYPESFSSAARWRKYSTSTGFMWYTWALIIFLSQIQLINCIHKIPFIYKITMRMTSESTGHWAHLQNYAYHRFQYLQAWVWAYISL